MTIPQKADQSIEFSRAANEVFAKMVPTLEVIQKALEERQGQVRFALLIDHDLIHHSFQLF